jgi:hypothetical protein
MPGKALALHWSQTARMPLRSTKQQEGLSTSAIMPGAFACRSFPLAAGLSGESRGCWRGEMLLRLGQDFETNNSVIPSAARDLWQVSVVDASLRSG